MNASEVHGSVRRGIAAGLIDSTSRLPLRKPLEDYLLHGVHYAFPASPGRLARGIPTAYAAPPLSDKNNPDQLWSGLFAEQRGPCESYAGTSSIFTFRPKARAALPSVLSVTEELDASSSLSTAARLVFMRAAICVLLNSFSFKR